MNFQTFYKLNKSKLLPIFVLYLAISFCTFLVIGLYDFYIDQNQEIKEIFLLDLIYGTAVASIVYFITLGSSFYYGRIRHSLMEQEPLNQLNRIDFGPILVWQHSRFKFSQLAYGKFISYYPIIFSISDYKGRTTIAFTVYYKRKRFRSTERKEIEKNILSNNVNYSKTKLSISYSKNEIIRMDINQIEQDLHEMIALMKLYEFESSS